MPKSEGRKISSGEREVNRQGKKGRLSSPKSVCYLPQDPSPHLGTPTEKETTFDQVKGGTFANPESVVRLGKRGREKNRGLKRKLGRGCYYS